MDGNQAKLVELISSLEGKDVAVDSRATSPGPGPKDPKDPAEDKSRLTRNRPRTYPYFNYLPYEVESHTTRDQNFQCILKHLYIAVEAGDFSGGAVHWTRELRNWLGLKFDPTKEDRIRLVRLYYELALAPGIDITAAERFSSMFMVLTKSASSIAIHSY